MVRRTQLVVITFTNELSKDGRFLNDFVVIFFFLILNGYQSVSPASYGKAFSGNDAILFPSCMNILNKLYNVYLYLLNKNPVCGDFVFFIAYRFMPYEPKNFLKKEIPAGYKCRQILILFTVQVIFIFFEGC